MTLAKSKKEEEQEALGMGCGCLVLIGIPLFIFASIWGFFADKSENRMEARDALVEEDVMKVVDEIENLSSDPSKINGFTVNTMEQEAWIQANVKGVMNERVVPLNEGVTVSVYPVGDKGEYLIYGNHQKGRKYFPSVSEKTEEGNYFVYDSTSGKTGHLHYTHITQLASLIEKQEEKEKEKP